LGPLFFPPPPPAFGPGFFPRFFKRFQRIYPPPGALLGRCPPPRGATNTLLPGCPLATGQDQCWPPLCPAILPRMNLGRGRGDHSHLLHRGDDAPWPRLAHHPPLSRPASYHLGRRSYRRWNDAPSWRGLLGAQRGSLS